MSDADTEGEQPSEGAHSAETGASGPDERPSSDGGQGEQRSEGAESGESSASEQAEGGASPEDQPTIEADERADIGELADLAEQVEAEAGASTDDESEASETEREAIDQSPRSTNRGASPDWGDLYVGTVTTGLNAVIEEYGDEDVEPVDESLARDLHLDEYVNDWMAEQGKAEMDPAQGMILATGALCLTVLVGKTDLPNQLLTKVNSTE